MFGESEMIAKYVFRSRLHVIQSINVFFFVVVLLFIFGTTEIMQKRIKI